MMNARVFWQASDCPEHGPDRGAWFWVETDERDEAVGDIIGPFDTALEAGAHARKAVIRRGTQ